MPNINFGDNPKPAKGEIKWGTHDSSPKELIKPSDILNVDPSWFAGIKQTDAYSCAFFVLTGLERMQRDATAFGVGSQSNEEVQSGLVASTGLNKLRSYIQEGRTDQLSVTEFRERLLNVGSKDSKVFTSRDDLPFDRENTRLGLVASDAIKRGYGVGIELHDQGHLVMAIGTSKDGKELICWDPLLGDPDKKHPGSLLRRVRADSDQVMMWGGLQLSEKYKNPKSSLAFKSSFTSSSEGVRPQLIKYASNRRGLWDRVKDFVDVLK